MIQSEVVAERDRGRVHTVSVVIPVYQGSRTLDALMSEIRPLAVEHSTPGGRRVVVNEVILVDDNGPDASDTVIRRLADEWELVHPVWLSRNYGQHAATLAGMATSGGDWIATIDEDGQHDPADIDRMIDTAVDARAGVVYAHPVNRSSHGWFRDATSRGAKRVLSAVFGGANPEDYQSYRLLLGELGRSVAAYAGSGVYLDVALGWVSARTATCPVNLRDEGDRRSGYSLRRLLAHFLRMIVSTGTRGLRVVSAIGVLFALAGLVFAVFLIVNRFASGSLPEGWTSTIVAILISSGAVLFSLGVIAEYIGVSVNMAMGKPLYLIVRDPASGPLGARPPHDPPG